MTEATGPNERTISNAALQAHLRKTASRIDGYNHKHLRDDRTHAQSQYDHDVHALPVRRKHVAGSSTL